jgi:hypothetical protein
MKINGLEITHCLYNIRTVFDNRRRTMLVYPNEDGKLRIASPWWTRTYRLKSLKPFIREITPFSVTSYGAVGRDSDCVDVGIYKPRMKDGISVEMVVFKNPKGKLRAVLSGGHSVIKLKNLDPHVDSYWSVG